MSLGVALLTNQSPKPNPSKHSPNLLGMPSSLHSQQHPSHHALLLARAESSQHCLSTRHRHQWKSFRPVYDQENPPDQSDVSRPVPCIRCLCDRRRHSLGTVSVPSWLSVRSALHPPRCHRGASFLRHRPSRPSQVTVLLCRASVLLPGITTWTGISVFPNPLGG